MQEEIGGWRCESHNNRHSNHLLACHHLRDSFLSCVHGRDATDGEEGEMKTRRHTNNKRYRQIKNGKTVTQVEQMERRLRTLHPASFITVGYSAVKYAKGRQK